jgi:hypothetical protein
MGVAANRVSGPIARPLGARMSYRLAPMSTNARDVRPDQDRLAVFGCSPYAAAKPSRQVG